MTPRPGPCVQNYTAHGSVLLQNHFWSHMKGQINYRDIAPCLHKLIATENMKRKPFILGRVFLILGLLIFVGSFGAIFYNISNVLNWIVVIYPCTNFQFNLLAFLLLSCIALLVKHPIVTEGQASLSGCYSLGSFGTERQGPLSLLRPSLIILLHTSALLTRRAECLSLYQAENSLTPGTQMSKHMSRATAFKSLFASNAPVLCFHGLTCPHLYILKHTSNPTTAVCDTPSFHFFFLQLHKFLPSTPKPNVLIIALEKKLATFISILYSKPSSKD